MNTESRVLLFTPTGRDAGMLTSALAGSNIDCVRSNSWSSLLSLMSEGAAAVILAEEVLDPAGMTALGNFLRAQPTWSDLPILLLTGRGADSPRIHAATMEMANVTLLERPTRVGALVSAVRAALRSRARQYESRAQLLELERAAVELKTSHRLLREANLRKDEFLATLAHELRNPLAPIRNALHVMRRKSPDAALDPLHAIIDRQVVQLVRLVDDLLEVSRTSQGKIALHVEKLDVTSVIKNAIETSRPLIDAARHKLVVEQPLESILIRGDAVRLGQIFANLLSNAAKYTDDGGVITVNVSAKAGQAVVAVSDTGLGIAPEMMESIFDMFTQIRGTSDRAQGGLGIGLTLVKRLLDLHGGRIEVSSAGAGKGSTFTVYLDLADESSRSAAAGPGAALIAPPLPRIVLVDDNRDAADTLAMALKSHGADVQIHYNAADVLKHFPSKLPAVVIADIGMPQMDGYELARRIRTSSDKNSVRLIALSGWGQEADRERAAAAGFDAHLIKPADVEEVLRLVISFYPDRSSVADKRTYGLVQ